MADLRLAEMLAALSQVTDLGMGQPAGTAIRTCLLATGLARRMNLPEPDVADVFLTALLQHIGCTAYAHETAAIAGGDDIGFRRAGALVDDENMREVLAFFLTGIARGSSPPSRVRAIFRTLRAGSEASRQLYRANCEVAVRTAERLGLPGGVQHGLDTIYARWDGKGTPDLSGEAIAPAACFAQVAGQAILFHDLGGPDTALATIRARAGTALDPAIAAVFARHGRSVLTEIDAVDPFVAMLDAEPEPHQRVPEMHLDAAARAFADITDLKSPWLHGHSAGVATIAASAATQLGLSTENTHRIRLAGYLHDLGRVGVPSGIWDKAGPLTSTEWEQVRLHAYHSERILDRCPLLVELATIAGMHHERLDGSGYHRGATGSAIPIGARTLAVADTWDAMTHDRPHRPARTPDAAASELVTEASKRRLDPEVVQAVLSSSGQTAAGLRQAWPAGLTDREVEVLRLATRGLSNREIGAALFISPKTAGHHIQHIYDKIGVSTRAGAALFAMEHDLLHKPLG